MRVYVDMDDVLCETAASLCGMAEREFARRVRYEDVKHFDLQKVFSLDDGEMAAFRALSHSPQMLSSYPKTAGAVEGMRALAAAGHRVEIVTGRPASANCGTLAWLASAGLGEFPVAYVDKYGRADCFARSADDPPTFSTTELKARRYDIAVDDSPLALDILADWPETRVLVFNRPWNAAYTLAPNMKRVSGWKEIVREVSACNAQERK